MSISRRSFLGTSGGIVASAASGGTQTAAASALPVVRMSRTELPVLRAGDAVVAGGSLAGVQIALTLARAGRKVVLVEPRTYLGREITAHLRPWLPAGPDRPDLLRACAGKTSAIHMDRFKLTLEDQVLDAGIDLVYASFPIGLTGDGLVVANKSGRQAIESRLIVDATETAIVARLAGAEFEPAPAQARYYRTIEYDEAGEWKPGALSVSPELKLADDRAILHPGYRGAAHVQVEFGLDLPVGEFTHESWMKREIEARKRTFSLAAFLARHHPAFRRAFLAHTSYELAGAATSRMQAPAPAWATRLSKLAPFAAPLPGIWCLEAGRAAMPADPVGRVHFGEQFASDLLASWNRAVSPGKFSPPRADTAEVRADLEVREPESPQRGRQYRTAAVAPADVPVARQQDVLVVGGGTSGATAAAVAAREGMRTAVLEMNPGLGGTGTIAGVDSYWFGRKVGFAARIKERVRQVHESIGYDPGKSADPKWNIEAKMFALLREADQAGAAIWFRSIVAGAIVERGNRVRGVVAATPYGLRALLAKVVIDASGDGDVAAFAGAEFVSHSAMDHLGMWHNFAQFVRPGRNTNHFTSSVDIANIEDCNRAILVGRRRGQNCHDHGIYVAPRESRHILGDVVLTMTDLLRHRAWPDVIGIHYGNSDMKGKSTSPWLFAGLIPPNLESEICYRMVVPKGLEDILIAGKAFSATHDGLAGVRFQADLENLGGTLALAAAKAVKENRAPRNIDVGELQRRLVSEGVLPESVLARKLRPRRYSHRELRELVGAMLADQPLLSYQQDYADEPLRRPIPFVEVCTAGPRVVPLLIQALNSSTPRKALVAQALALCGSKAGVPVLVASLEKSLSEERLPPLTKTILHANIPPDQGAMPDAAYLLYTLGMTRDRRAIPIWRRVAELTKPTEEQFRSRIESPFHYIDAVCFGAERLGHPAALPVLETLHSQALLHDQTARRGLQPDFMVERRALLELGIAKAMARCGSARGYEILAGYLDDNRATLAEQAHLNLIRIAGLDLGKDGSAWKQWLDVSRGALEPVPLMEDLDAVYEREILVSV